MATSSYACRSTGICDWPFLVSRWCQVVTELWQSKLTCSQVWMDGLHAYDSLGRAHRRGHVHRLRATVRLSTLFQLHRRRLSSNVSFATSPIRFVFVERETDWGLHDDRAASAVAANIILRSSFAAGFPLFSTQMFENMGVQWACTLLGCVAAVMIPIPVAFRMYGPRLRGKSKMLRSTSTV